MLKENVKDAAQIIQNILIQPLAISGASSEICLLKAAENYHPSQGNSSDLSMILQTFLEYRGPTDMLIQELELIIQDLNERK